MKSKVHNLRVDEGRVTVGDETTWPDIVNVSVPKHIVLSLLAKLTSSLQSADDADVQVTFMGKLDYDIEK
jgi:hypothetical protein